MCFRVFINFNLLHIFRQISTQLLENNFHVVTIMNEQDEAKRNRMNNLIVILII